MCRAVVCRVTAAAAAAVFTGCSISAAGSRTPRVWGRHRSRSHECRAVGMHPRRIAIVFSGGWKWVRACGRYGIRSTFNQQCRDFNVTSGHDARSQSSPLLGQGTLDCLPTLSLSDKTPATGDCASGTASLKVLTKITRGCRKMPRLFRDAPAHGVSVRRPVHNLKTSPNYYAHSRTCSFTHIQRSHMPGD